MQRIKANISPKTKKKVEGVYKIILQDVKPTESEIKVINSCVNDLMGRLKKVAPKGVEIVNLGSVARGTNMRGNHDIDIFILYPQRMDEKEMEKEGMNLAKKIVAKHKGESFYIKYAEHPYVQLMLNDLGIKADLVPAFKIKNASERITAVDRTQLHNKFLSENLTKKQKDDVIVLKAFLKSHSIYGAGAEVEGFSGYLCELLVYHYGSFMDVLANIASLRLPILIHPLDREEYQGTDGAVKEAVKKFGREFIVIDPTDEDRNVAAVVTDESLARFIIISKIFLKNPTANFFYGTKYSDTFSERKLLRLRKELGLDIYAVHMKTPDIAEDIIWQQVRRMKGRIDFELRKNSFVPVLAFENVSKENAVIAFFISNAHIKYTEHKGPSVFMGEAMQKFIDSHPRSLGMYFEQHRIVSIEEAEHKSPDSVINAILAGKEGLPDFAKKKGGIKLHINTLPEDAAKLVYRAFIRKTSI